MRFGLKTLLLCLIGALAWWVTPKLIQSCADFADDVHLSWVNAYGSASDREQLQDEVGKKLAVEANTLAYHELCCRYRHILCQRLKEEERRGPISDERRTKIASEVSELVFKDHLHELRVNRERRPRRESRDQRHEPPMGGKGGE